MTEEKSKIMLPEYIENIIERIEIFGYEGYAVGGCVRDSLLKREPKDWDVTASALPCEIKKIFSDKKVIDTGEAHGTETVVEKGQNVEITTYRFDGEYKDARHPEKVEFTSDIREDLARRDFTVNAMAYNEKDGLIDIFGGEKDLKNGILRCVGDAEKRFSEDALRIMRMYRFCSELGFEIEEKSRDGAKKCAGLLGKISKERISAELFKLLLGKNAVRALIMMQEDGVLSEILGGITIGEENLVMLERACYTLNVRIAVLFYGNLQGDEAEKLLRNLKSPNKVSKGSSDILRFADELCYREKNGIRMDLRKYGEDLSRELYCFAEAKDGERNLCDALEEELNSGNAFSLGGLAVNGEDLMKEGIAEGYDIGKILNMLLDKIIEEPELNEKDKLIKIAKGVLS